MPRRTEDAAFRNQVEPEECLEFDDHEEEVEEEEVEYEEIEEEVEEVEEEVEEDEDILEEVEESEEEEDPEEREVDDSDSKLEVVHQQVEAEDGNDREKHAELLSLPPHGSEVYVGGISTGASSEDLKKLCEPVGEVVEVSTPTFLRLTFLCVFSALTCSPFLYAGENNARQAGQNGLCFCYFQN
jgi:heterogeneous nuclear ribonucleoprotein R